MLKVIIKFIFSKIFLKNLILFALAVILLTIISNYILDKYTLHNQEITVPDLNGLAIKEINEIIKNKKLRFEIVDSSYVKDKAPMSVLDQNPAANTKVKENRKIYVTINAINPPKVKLPNVIDQSSRIAIEQLKMVGLKVSELKYRPHFARDAVLSIVFKEKKIKPGTILIKGSELILVVGMGTSNVRVTVPDLKGLTIEEADETLLENSLNLGRIIYDETVVDTPFAEIISQNPTDTLDNGTRVKLTLGDIVDIWVTQEYKVDSIINNKE